MEYLEYIYLYWDILDRILMWRIYIMLKFDYCFYYCNICLDWLYIYGLLFYVINIVFFKVGLYSYIDKLCVGWVGFYVYSYLCL